MVRYTHQTVSMNYSIAVNTDVATRKTQPWCKHKKSRLLNHYYNISWLSSCWNFEPCFLQCPVISRPWWVGCGLMHGEVGRIRQIEMVVRCTIYYSCRSISKLARDVHKICWKTHTPYPVRTVPEDKLLAFRSKFIYVSKEIVWASHVDWLQKVRVKLFGCVWGECGSGQTHDEAT